PLWAESHGWLKKFVNSALNCMLNLSLICVFLRMEKSTLLLFCTRRYENRSGNVRRLLASWSLPSRLKPTGLVSGVPGPVVGLSENLHGSLKLTNTGCPLASRTTAESALLSLVRNATKPLLLIHCDSDCWLDGMTRSLKSPL